MLASLALSGFRNLADQRVDLPAAGMAVVADNGQGKTNFLEAIYYLEIFRSFRGAPDEQLVRFGADFFRVEGKLTIEGRTRTVAAALDRRSRRKKVTIDGQEPERIGDAIGHSMNHQNNGPISARTSSAPTITAMRPAPAALPP